MSLLCVGSLWNLTFADLGTPATVKFDGDEGGEFLLDLLPDEGERLDCGWCGTIPGLVNSHQSGSSSVGE